MDAEYVMHKPRPPLSDLIECIWLVKSGPLPHPRERIFPNGDIEWCCPC